jgi:DNA sulfur modification protein DndC
MRLTQQPLFGDRLTLIEAIGLTVESLQAYGSDYHHWVLAFSGGKDSTVVVSLLAWLIEQGHIEPPPAGITVLMSDTRQEFLPLHLAALETLKVAQSCGFRARVVQPPFDHRMYVYMLGRGVPPASNVFRWCTRILKADPMARAIEALAETNGQVLVLTGVRQGESAARDQRIALSCSRDGGECGQGWFQNASRDGVASTLAPLLHWRLCHIEDWLRFYAPEIGLDSRPIIDIYGFEEDEQMNLRTGCAGCMLIEEDRALARIVQLPGWGYLAPLQRLKAVYRELKRPQNRLRKWGERKKDGSLGAKQGRLGPLTMEARRWGLEQVLAIQEEINGAARVLGRPELHLITDAERERVLELIEANTWPRGWTGEEPRGDELVDKIVAEGVTLPVLIS